MRVSEEELDKFNQAAKLGSYAPYSGLIRETALMETDKVMEKRILRKGNSSNDNG